MKGPKFHSHSLHEPANQPESWGPLKVKKGALGQDRTQEYSTGFSLRGFRFYHWHHMVPSGNSRRVPDHGGGGESLLSTVVCGPHTKIN